MNVMSHVTHMNGSCHTYECVVVRCRCDVKSHVTHMNESCLFVDRDVFIQIHSYVRHDMTHSYVRHDSFICV